MEENERMVEQGERPTPTQLSEILSITWKKKVTKVFFWQNFHIQITKDVSSTTFFPPHYTFHIS